MDTEDLIGIAAYMEDIGKQLSIKISCEVEYSGLRFYMSQDHFGGRRTLSRYVTYIALDNANVSYHKVISDFVEEFTAKS